MPKVVEQIQAPARDKNFEIITQKHLFCNKCGIGFSINLYNYVEGRKYYCGKCLDLKKQGSENMRKLTGLKYTRVIDLAEGVI